MLQSKISTKKSNVCGGAGSGVMRAQFSALTEGGSQQLTLAPLASSEGASAPPGHHRHLDSEPHSPPHNTKLRKPTCYHLFRFPFC